MFIKHPLEVRHLKEIGIVKKVKGKNARVVIEQHAACGDCHKCEVSSDKRVMATDAKNEANAKVGDAVAVEMEFNNFMHATWIAYGIPCIMFLVGCFLGFYLAPSFGLDQTYTSFFTGLILTALSYVIIHIFDRRGAFKGKKFEPVITEVLSEQTLDALHINLMEARAKAEVSMK